MVSGMNDGPSPAGPAARPVDHVTITPAILYFGTPVVLLSTENEDGSFNLAPMSSAWALGQVIVLGLGAAGQTAQNLRSRPDLVINVPAPEQWQAVERLAPLTGRSPVPGHKRAAFRFEPGKFAAAGLQPELSDLVRPPRVAECPLQMEARAADVRPGVAGEFLVIQAQVLAVHADPRIVVPGSQHIDPARWSPLIYNFRHYYGLGTELGHSFRSQTRPLLPGTRRTATSCAAALSRLAGREHGRERTVGPMTDIHDGPVEHVQAGAVRLAYRTWGPADAPPVVLLHALGEQSSDWTSVAAALAPSWRVYAPDLRGHGASDWPGSYTIEQLTTDLEAFLNELGLEEVTLAGHSLGAPPAYLYAARHPGRVTRLVLEEPAPPWPRARRDAVRPEGPLAFDWPATALSNEFTDPQVSSWRASLPLVQAPALLVAGGPDSHVDQGLLANMATLIPDCQLVTIPAGHLVHANRPAEFTAAVTSFLRVRR